MDGIEKITGRIAADGQKEADAILAEARRQAGEIAARYDMAERDEESGRFIVRDGSEWIVFDYFGRETTRYRKEKSKTYEYGKC